ncbi:G-type lectin S-receptor-like serine/threonine-protein kinase CES101 isoform X2 [Mangifera indica]|uniref:G-type lectin S-receptor-like serine/threonine-protein kinase CES101 isoform X2 n=1 Tax=Mangifera indica TaxID=29780 RepID=UPI001CFAB5DB|nr:G-type lectin S-receptor-like serine/threonine-protein kinase CES101 isoform X2 [Mangifera indica]
MASRGRNHFLFSFSCLVFLSGFSHSSTDRLVPGQQLKDGDQLVSAFGKFSLKFFSPKDVEKRYLGILYKGDKPVWVANRNTPILDESGSLTIDSSDGNLKIFYQGGDPYSISWVQGVTIASTATLLKTGNLVLQEINSNGSMGRMLWQSFDYPTDTLLPGMKLGINLQTGHKWFLQSWINEISPAQGSFTLGMCSNFTNKLAIWWRGEVYWTGELWLNEQSISSNSWNVENYEFRLVANEHEKYFTYFITGPGDPFFMPKIQPDGSSEFRGHFLNEKVFQKDPLCSTTHLSCEIWGREANFIESYEGVLYTRHIRILREKQKEYYTVAYTVAKNKRRFPLKVAVGAAILVFLMCYSIYFIWRIVIPKVLSKRKRKKLLRMLRQRILLITPYGKKKREEEGHGIGHELKIFDFQVISAATENFSADNKLGEGGFGPVYKGQLPDGQQVAIKRLSRRSGQGIVEFENEAKIIAKLQHTNLVRLLGCCLHEEERILVYEYMPNKSLDFFIFDSNRKNLLNWRKRFSIIEGVAQGLLYLHKYSRLRVIHRDLKASNILLDEQMNPRISDFGMARIFHVNESEANTRRVCGTYGYMSPEYAINGTVSTKIDVFSFGVLVLEIISGQKNNRFYHTERPLNLLGYAWQLWKEGKSLELIDQKLGASCSPNEVLRCIHVGLLCVQDQARDRPTMFTVVSMLTNETMLLPDPQKPAFFINVTDEELHVPENKSENCSNNDVTISVMVAR